MHSMPGGVHADWPASRFAGETRFDGMLGRLEVSAELADSLLPGGFERLASGCGNVELGVAFGHQSDGATLFGGAPVPWGVAYGELVLVVPGVRVVGASHAGSFVARMLTGYFPAIFDGNLHYGYSKRSARMSWDGRRFVARDERRGDLLVLADLFAPGDGAGSADTASSAALAPFDAPMLGAKQGGRPVESWFGFDLRGAQVAAATATLYVEPAAEPILPPGSYRAEGIRVEGMLWRLSWPRPLAHAAPRPTATEG